VTLTPEPNEHWVFKQWEGDGSGSSTPLQLTMTTNKSVVGVFVKRDYPLKITITGEGTVEEKIVTIEDASVENNEDIHEYLKGIFLDLAKLSLASFTDSAFGKITGSERTLTS
jgi:hypothetical protein